MPEEKTEWQPSPKIVKEIKKFILGRFADSDGVYDFNNIKKKPRIPYEFIDRYAKIGAFLQDKAQVIVQLKKLNNLLVQEGKARNASEINERGETVLAPAEHNKFYAPHRKILRVVLETELAKFGFQSKLAKVNGFLNAGMFREILRSGLLLKDPGLRDITHGDFTHAIQWLIIAWQQQDSGFLNKDKKLDKEASDKSVITIFQSLGRETAVISSSKPNVPGLSENELSIWNLIVDSVPTYSEDRFGLEYTNLDYFEEKDPRGFRVPNTFHIFLIKNEIPELSFLKSLILSREIKRAKETDKTLVNTYFNEDKNHKKMYPNTKYSSSSLPEVQLPIDILESLKNLNLEIDNKDFQLITINKEVKKLDNSDPCFFSPIKDSYKIFLNAKSILDSAIILFDRQKYQEAIKIFISIEEDFANMGIIVQQNGYYYIGYAQARINEIKTAEFYMRKALYVSRVAEESGITNDGFIPKDNIIKELGIYQHILRAKAEPKTEEQSSNCIIT